MKLKDASVIAAMVILVTLVTACGAPDAPATQVLIQASPTDAPATLAAVQPTATRVRPTKTPRPESCEEVEGNCLEILFDGGSCALEGPTLLSTGSITVVFHNESEDGAAAELLKLRGDKTIQDLIDDAERRPTEYAPDWVTLWGMWKTVQPGEVYSHRGVLEAGSYGVVCGRVEPHRIWFGGGLTVDE